MAALLTTVLIALGVSFLCSILEAALFTVRTTELVHRKEHGDRGAEILLDIKRNRIDDAISAILILNTIAHTIGAAVAGAQAAALWGDTWVGVFSAVLTLLVLVVTEIIPKTIGATYASALVPFVSRTLVLLMKVCYPLLLLTRMLTRLIGSADHSSISRGEVKAMVDSATRDGLLHEDEARIVNNTLRIGQVDLRAVMTPRPVVKRLSADVPAAAVLEPDFDIPYTRLPVYDGEDEHIVGYVRVPEVAQRATHGEGDVPLSEMMRPIPAFNERATVGEALRVLVRDRTHIALVQDEFGGMAGIITLEDLLETLLGAEIVDESDQVEDLRELAIRLRRERTGDWPDDETDESDEAG